MDCEELYHVFLAHSHRVLNHNANDMFQSLTTAFIIWFRLKVFK